MDWTENDTPRNNEDFVGDLGVKAFPGSSESMEEVASLFMDDDVFRSILKELTRIIIKITKNIKIL